MASHHRGSAHIVAGIMAFAILAALVPACDGVASAAPEVTRRAKVDLLQAFEKRCGGAPGLLVLGSSRAMRVDPAQLRSALRLRTFNAAVSSGTVPDAYAFLRFARRRYPAASPAVLWFLDVESMRLPGCHPYLLSVKRLADCLPKGADRRTVSLPRGLAAGAAEGAPVVRPRWHRDGLLVSWWHDWQRSRGRTTDAGVRYHQRQLAAVYRGGWPGMSGSAKWYATQIVRQANEMGAAPVVVLTPYHPRLRGFLAARGWRRAHRQVRRFLTRLATRFDLRVVDLTGGAVVDGRPGSWYDGVHPRAGQMRRIVRAVIGRAGEHLVAAAAPLSPPVLLSEPFGPVERGSAAAPGAVEAPWALSADQRSGAALSSGGGTTVDEAPVWPMPLPAIPSAAASDADGIPELPTRFSVPWPLPSIWQLPPQPRRL